MLGLLSLPPLFNLVILLAILTYLVYHTVVTGVQPLTVVLFVVIIFALARLLFKMARKTHVDESE